MFFVLILASAFIFCGCSDSSGCCDTSYNVSSPAVATTVSPESFTIDNTAQKMQLDITGIVHWTITVTDTTDPANPVVCDWLNAEPSEGQGTMSVSLSASENTSGAERKAELYVSDGVYQTITVNIVQSL